MNLTADQLLTALKYDDSEKGTIEIFMKGAIAFLKGAGAFRESNELTETVILLIVGFWMDNRELNFSEFKNIKDFPLGMQGLLNSLKYSPDDPVEIMVMDGDVIE